MSTYYSELRCAKISLRNIISQFTNTISDNPTILQVNSTHEKPCTLRNIFYKLDDRRNSKKWPLTFSNNTLGYSIFELPDSAHLFIKVLVFLITLQLLLVMHTAYT